MNCLRLNFFIKILYISKAPRIAFTTSDSFGEEKIKARMEFYEEKTGRGGNESC